MKQHLTGLAALALLAIAPVQAQEAAVCAATIAPTGELAPWTTPIALDSSASQPGAALKAGQAARVKLHPQADVRFAAEPGRQATSPAYAGLLQVEIPEPGDWRVALGTNGWVDVLVNRKAVESFDYGHGPECTGVHKMVDFTLPAGRHIVQIAANPTEETTVLVVPLP